MKIAELIRDFCDTDIGYTFYNDYSGRGMFGKTCVGIVVAEHCSYMEMMMLLTKYLTMRGFDDVDLELSNPAIDSLGLDTIVYFPSIKPLEE